VETAVGVVEESEERSEVVELGENAFLGQLRVGSISSVDELS